MKFLRNTLLAGMLLLVQAAGAQTPQIIQQYIDTYKDIAMEEMLRTGVPASIKLAQGIHETTAGTSVLVLKSNNHFGIKCKTGWKGESVSHTDDAPHECFRKYNDPTQSYRDHSDFLKNSARYASLFNLDPMNYQGWANGLKKAGYATNPKYPQIIIRLIETYHLQDYTLIALGKMDPQKEVMAKVKPETIILNEPQEETTPTAPAQTARLAEKPTYPNGEFKINDTRVIYALAGTSLLSIAQKYHLPLARIFEFNEMEEMEALPEDQLVFLQRKRKTGNSEYHIVKEGETLRDIASVQAIRLETLLEYNHLQLSMQPAIGEQLYLKRKAPGMPKLERHESGASQSFRNGETVSRGASSH